MDGGQMLLGAARAADTVSSSTTIWVAVIVGVISLLAGVVGGLGATLLTLRAAGRRERRESYVRSLVSLAELGDHLTLVAHLPSEADESEPDHDRLRLVDAETDLLGTKPVRAQMKKVGSAAGTFWASVAQKEMREPGKRHAAQQAVDAALSQFETEVRTLKDVMRKRRGRFS